MIIRLSKKGIVSDESGFRCKDCGRFIRLTAEIIYDGWVKRNEICFPCAGKARTKWELDNIDNEGRGCIDIQGYKGLDEMCWCYSCHKRTPSDSVEVTREGGEIVCKECVYYCSSCDAPNIEGMRNCGRCEEILCSDCSAEGYMLDDGETYCPRCQERIEEEEREREEQREAEAEEERQRIAESERLSDSVE